MKLKINVKTILLMGAMTMASLSSCKKNEDVSADSQAAEDNAYAEGTFNDAFNGVDAAVKGQTGYYKTAEATIDMLSGPCVTITVDTASSPRKVILDFGTSGCLRRDGRTRSGQI